MVALSNSFAYVDIDKEIRKNRSSLLIWFIDRDRSQRSFSTS